MLARAKEVYKVGSEEIHHWGSCIQDRIQRLAIGYDALSFPGPISSMAVKYFV